MKKKLVTADNIDDLKQWWQDYGKQQYATDVDGAVRAKKNWKSRNGHQNGGWCVGGSAGYTRLIKAARLPYDLYWSGSNPTPSTQYPAAIYRYLRNKYPDFA